ncbi:3-isopropylmalate dehydrogenase [Chloroflexota bacterium]
MRFEVVLLPGDGVGLEIVAAATKVLEAVGAKYGHDFNFQSGLIGGAAIDAEGEAVTEATLALCRKADAVLLGAVGGPKWDDPTAKIRPEDGLLALRKKLGLFANLRPVNVFPMLIDGTNLKPEVIRGANFIFVRELTGGLYFGRPKKRWQTARGRKAVDSMVYSEPEIRRILKVGFEIARTRGKKLVSVDKANVLETSRLWRQMAAELSLEYPDVEMENMLVDACAMRLIQNPKYFDVLVTENTFGDILTDEASMLAGSLGMLPSASMADIPVPGKRAKGLYEPIHGSAPRHAGLDEINPIATIMSAAMMLRYSMALPDEAVVVEAAVLKVLEKGFRTYDIMSSGMKKVGTAKMGSLVCENI